MSPSSLVPITALLALSLAGCTSVLHEEIQIHAPREQVWDVLTDFESYPEWNPFFVKVSGEMCRESELEVSMQPVDKDPQDFSPTILEVEPLRRLVWRGRLWIPWVFDGTHTFEIRAVDANTVSFIQQEDFAGMLVPFAGFEPYRAGWQRMNRALKKRAEGMAEGRQAKPVAAREE